MIGSASAADSDTLNNQGNLTATDTTDVGSTIDEKGDSGENPLLESNSNEDVLSSDGLEKTVLGATSDELLSDGDKTFTDLKNEIADGSSITLSGNYYQYVSADGNNYGIDVTNKIIDGNGATIDGSNLHYPFISSGNITFKNINFINVKTSAKVDNNFRGGPVLFNVGSNNVIFDNCNFSKLTSTINEVPGAIGIPEGNNITIKNCNFYDNTAYNALILFYSSTGYVNENITIENCKFERITTTKYNGVLYYSGVKNLTMKKCEFTNISGSTDAIIVARNSDNCDITNCKFINKTDSKSGVIAFFNSNNIIIKNCILTNITGVSSQNMGSIYFNKAENCIIDNVNFTHIKNFHWGAGIRIASYGSGYAYNFTINHCNFYDVGTLSAGGAIYTSGHQRGDDVSYINFYNCYFEKCYHGTTIARGSCMELNAHHVNITNCTFINNKANGSGTVGLYSTASYCTIFNCTFINNSAKQGGAISAEQEACHDAHIINCTFINNTANAVDKDVNSGCGGAITFYASNSIIDDCIFINNTAISSDTTKGSGGAIDFKAKDCNVTNCNFTGNNASDHGGAIHFAANNSYVKDCNFVNNTANDGGGMCSEAPLGSISYVERSTFTGNNAVNGTDFYVHEGSEIRFVGLKFKALWLTNDNETDGRTKSSVLNGYGTWYNRPARWDEKAMEFLDTTQGKTTIYQQQHINKNQPTN